MVTIPSGRPHWPPPFKTATYSAFQHQSKPMAIQPKMPARTGSGWKPAAPPVYSPKPLSPAVQPKLCFPQQTIQGQRPLGQELAYVIQQRQGRVHRPGNGINNPTIQQKGAKQLAALAQPKVFQGPTVDVQNKIVAELEELAKGDTYPKIFGQPKQVIGLGSIQLPADLNVTIEGLINTAHLTETPTPSVPSSFKMIEKNEALKKKIVTNTISTMVAAGQIEYLKTSGLSNGEWTVWVEIHYYRGRVQSEPGFHKDTLGQTLFVNLNYVNDQEIAGPEFIVNPPTVEGHQTNINKTLPPKFLTHLAKAKKAVEKPTGIGAATIPANGVVSFVDELIHHKTPTYGHRKVPARSLATFLQKKFPDEYSKAVWWYDSYVLQYPAWSLSWLASWRSASAAKSYDLNLRWHRWIQMAKSGSMFDRTQLLAAGLSQNLVDELVDEYSENASGFREVSIPKTAKVPIGTPRLTRRMSLNAINKVLPQQVAVGSGRRAFFRTWVRAIKRQKQ